MTKSQESIVRAKTELARLKPGSELKELQQEVLSALANRESVFASLPTGYGKSLCFWLPAAAWGWRVWVISPLISLMEDQVASCCALGLKTLALHSANQGASTEARLRRGGWQILFLSPERLGAWWKNGKFRELQQAGLGPDLFALDEMHCFEDWSAFRTGFKDAFAPVRYHAAGGKPVLGLSASFSGRESDLWMSEFCENYRRVEGPLGRENLSLFVLPIERECWRWLALLAFLRDLQAPESALIYCSSREECDSVVSWLNAAGLPAVGYHAGLPKEMRRERSRAFRAGLLRIICATSAFGMGIDYPSVSRVLHFSAPYDLESYWQEVGRAGRDGRESVGLALWCRSDISRLRNMEGGQRERFGALWRAWLRAGCRKQAVGERIGLHQLPCGKCDRCRAQNCIPFPAQVRELEVLFNVSPWWFSSFSEPELWLEKKLLVGEKRLTGN